MDADNRTALTRAAAAFRTLGIRGVAGLLKRKIVDLHAQQKWALRRARRNVLEFGIRTQLLRGRVKHLHGPLHIGYRPDQLLVITVVRNGALYVKSFMEHYRGLGVAHYVFLDNGSTDGTVEMLCAYPGVTVLQTDAPYDRFENTMKRYLADRFSRGRWNLCADIDELFDYPCSGELPLPAFLGYLNRRGFTAVVAQMLDLFSETPLADLESTPEDRLKEKYPYYDISAVERLPYEWSQPVPAGVRMHMGGIRRAVFGTNNGLTKAALVLMNGRVKPFVGWHQVMGAVIADVSCVLLHYPFVSAFPAKVREAVGTGRYGAVTTDEYVAYDRALAGSPALGLKLPSARRYTGLEPLLAEGFLTASDEYRDWVRANRLPPDS